MKLTKTIILSILLLTLKSIATEHNLSIEGNATIELNTSDENQTVDANSTENIVMEVNTDNCVGCHGLNFEKPAMGMSSLVRDMTKEYIEATLFNYKYSSVEGDMNPLMSWQTAQLSDDEIRAIAEQIGK